MLSVHVVLCSDVITQFNLKQVESDQSGGKVVVRELSDPGELQVRFYKFPPL